jgi:hypothetical protein
MSSNRLMLGDVCLDKFLVEEDKNISNRKSEAEIDELIGKLKESPYPSERVPLERLIQQKINLRYPLINPMFLEMSNPVEYEGNKFSLPKFSVYSLRDNSFSILFERFLNTFNMAYDYLFSTNPDRRQLPQILNDQLYRGTDLSKNSGKTEYYVDATKIYNDPNRGINLRNVFVAMRAQGLKKYDFQRSLIFSSQFNAAIPENTKERIEEAKPFFKNDLYFITETKPEEWNVEAIKGNPKIVEYPFREIREITEDPLVVGVYRDRAYLVDFFDATPLEDYVRSEFTH